MDSVLAHAHTLTEDMRCSGCGQPKHEAWNADSAGWYAIREATCNGCAEVAKDADKDHPPDRKVWVVDERPPHVKLKPWKPN